MITRRDVLQFALGSGLAPFAGAMLAGEKVAFAAPSTIAVTGATLHVDGKTRIEGATLVVKDGAVVAAAKGAAVPAGATVIDGKGMVVTAGLVEPYTSLGLVEVDLVEETHEGTVKGGEIHAAYRASDAFNPSSSLIPVARSGGVTSAVAVPRGGILSGTSSWAALDGSPPTVPLLAMNGVLGEHSMGVGHGSRGRALEILREALDDAAAYARRRDAFERNQSRALSASRSDLEALQPVLAGTMPLVIDAHRAADMRAAMRLAEERKLKLVFAGATEAWELAGELAKANVPVILDPTANLPSTFDWLHVRDDIATVLVKAGVTVALSMTNLEEPWNARNVRQVAGVAVAHGLPWGDALAAITETAPRIFGQKRLGRLSPGYRADFVLWSGDPLEVTSRALRVFINGKEAGTRLRQTLLLERYRNLPK